MSAVQKFVIENKLTVYNGLDTVVEGEWMRFGGR